MFSLQVPFNFHPIIQAYLDPGTGSIIIQVVIAALVGGGLLLRTFWKKIFRKKPKPEDLPVESPTDESSRDDPPQ